MSIGIFPDILSQGILVGIILVGRLGITAEEKTRRSQVRLRRVLPQSTILPVEVRCYNSCCRCLARNARCNTMSHLTADGLFFFP